MPELHRHTLCTRRRGEQVELIGASASILRELATDPKWKDTQVVGFDVMSVHQMSKCMFDEA